MKIIQELPFTIEDLQKSLRSDCWSYQGFGMLRAYLDKEKRWRLNYWLPSIAVPNVSTIHDHPWSFTSYVLRGELTNIRYKIVNGPFNFSCQDIITGEEGKATGVIRNVRLLITSTELYRPGEKYMQSLEEIHETKAKEGTITLNDRTQPTKAHTARVFWPIKQDWVDAKPRKALKEEVELVKL